ncbi:MAG: recombinase family protein [Vulcanimicrobiota bacterium]
MKVVGYARVSTEEQASSGVSLQAQIEKLQAYASLYDLEIVEIIQDGGQSAKSLNRPGIQKALQMMRSGLTHGILVAKLDRLTRSIIDLNTLISDYFSEKAKYQASLFSVADQVDTRSAGGRLVLNVLMSVAQWEREAIGERTKAALNYKKSQGIKLGRPEKMITDPGEAKTIYYLRELREQGLTYRAIADRLSKENVRTFRGGKWYASTVKNLIKAEVA